MTCAKTESLSEQRFCRLLSAVSGTLSATAPMIWQTLQTAYQQPHRYYHTAQHIGECLQLFDRYRHLAEQPLAVEFALWFHDAIYQPQRPDNEQQSAAWTVEVLRQAQVAKTVQQQVSALILATAHQQPPKTNDEALMLDIDLAILASAPDRFAEYQQQIRAEYAWVAEQIYQQKRQEILTRLYNHGNIYHHAEIKAALECPARMNLQHALTL